LRITADNLTVAFGPVAALGPVSLEIKPGEFVAIIGPSGCGKSTFIRVLAGLQPPTSGHVRLDDRPLAGPSPRVGLMFQDANLMPWRTVTDNITLPLELSGMGRTPRQRAAQKLMPILGLGGFENAQPANLSGGMAQRVALGRVLIQDPDLLLLDEPFGALDALTREQISLDLLRIRQQKTVVTVTHDINEAVLLSDRVLVMSHRPGRIIGDLPVPLPRPRNLNQMYQPDFVEMTRQVRSVLNRA
jgi:NitT/TauT family transport system ATP-binding protein